MAQAQKKLKEVTEDLPFDDSAANEGSAENDVDPSEYQRMVAEVAYYRAEQRGFAPGDDQADWFEAEQEVKEKLAG